jgi:hypothetical protein
MRLFTQIHEEMSHLPIVGILQNTRIDFALDVDGAGSERRTYDQDDHQDL